MFDNYLRDQRPNWKRRALAIASFVLHGAAGAGLVAWTFFHVEEIAPPALALTFFSAAPPPPPPPPPPAGGSSAPQTPKKKVEVKPQPDKLVQPQEVKPIEEKPKDEPKNDSPEKGEEGGQKGGEVGGEKGGEVGGQLGGQKGGVLGSTGNGPPGGGGGGKYVPQFVLKASGLDMPKPSVPDWFYQEHRGQSPKGTYKMCIGTDGRVQSMEIVAGVSAGNMDQHVIEHVKSTWKFKPQPFVVCTNWQFVFDIR